MYELQKLSNAYNFKIRTRRTKVIAFREKCPIQSKISLNNNSIAKQVSNIKYLGCNVTHKCDEDLSKKKKRSISNHMCGSFKNVEKKN
jgi:hypothetical protein